MKALATAAALALIAVPAAAAEWTELYASGEWTADLGFVGTEPACFAGTRNGQTSLSIGTFQNGDILVSFINDAWAMPERTVDVRIDVGFDRFRSYADTSGSQASFYADPDFGADFLKALSNSTAVTLYTVDGNVPLMTLGLDGSRGAIDALVGCFSEILAEADPFAGTAPAASDPFAY